MRHNPLQVRIIALAAVAGLIFLASSVVNMAASNTVYSNPTPEGVLMPQINPPAPERLDSKPDKPKEEVYSRRLAFRVPGAEIDPVSFVSLTEKVTLKIVSVRPVKETKQDTRGKAIMLLMDNSYSMVQPSPPSPWNSNWLPRSDPEYKRIEAVELLLENLGPNDRVALASFPRLNPNPGYRIPRVEPPALMKGFSPAGEVLPLLASLREHENSGTPLFRCISMSIGWMAGEKDRPKICVVLTDGRDTTGDGQVPEGLRANLEAANIKLFIVALGPAPDLEMLGEVADEVIPVSDSKELLPTFKKLAERFETLTIGHDVELDIVREKTDFMADEDVVVGFRSNGHPEKMTLKAGTMTSRSGSGAK